MERTAEVDVLAILQQISDNTSTLVKDHHFAATARQLAQLYEANKKLELLVMDLHKRLTNLEHTQGVMTGAFTSAGLPNHFSMPPPTPTWTLNSQ